MKKTLLFAILFTILFSVCSCSKLGDGSSDGDRVEESYWDYYSNEDGVEINCSFQIQPLTKEDRDSLPFKVKDDINFIAQGGIIYVEEIDSSVNTSYVNDVYSAAFFTGGHMKGNKIVMASNEDTILSFEDGALVVDCDFITNNLHRKRHVHLKMRRITKEEWGRY